MYSPFFLEYLLLFLTKDALQVFQKFGMTHNLLALLIVELLGMRKALQYFDSETSFPAT